MHRLCGKKYWSLTLKPIQGTFLEVREKEQQKTIESGNKDYRSQKMESPHMDTYKKGRKGALKI